MHPSILFLVYFQVALKKKEKDVKVFDIASLSNTIQYLLL